jgi:hypothetical protein
LAIDTELETKKTTTKCKLTVTIGNNLDKQKLIPVRSNFPVSCEVRTIPVPNKRLKITVQPPKNRKKHKSHNTTTTSFPLKTNLINHRDLNHRNLSDWFAPAWFLSTTWGLFDPASLDD